MTWLDVRYGLATALLVAIGHWLIQGLWLGLDNPISWAVSAVVVGITVAVLRRVLRDQRRRVAGEDVPSTGWKAK